MKAVKDHPVHESWTLSPSRWTHPDLGGFWKTVTVQQHCSSSNSSSSSEADVLLLICLNTKFVKTCFTVGNLVYARQSADLPAKRAHYIGSEIRESSHTSDACLAIIDAEACRVRVPMATIRWRMCACGRRLSKAHGWIMLSSRWESAIPFRNKTELTFKRRSHCRVR